MISAKKVIRKTIGLILWFTLGLVFLFVALALLIQLAPVQTKIAHKVAAFVSNKTNTKVELEKVNISFPKSVLVEGLYLEDIQRDTLVYAGRLKVNMALADLLFGKITITTLTLDDATVKLYNSSTDKRFNYHFLTSAFSDTRATAKADTLSPAAWTFSVGKVYLRNISFLFNDNYKAMKVKVKIKKSDFNVKKIDLGESAYMIDKMLIDGLQVIVKQTMPLLKDTVRANVLMPKISLNQLQLNNASIQYTDSLVMLSLKAVIDRSLLEKGIIDLEAESITIAAFDLSKSNIKYHAFQPEMKLTTSKAAAPNTNNWKVAVDQLEMDENSFTYQTGNQLVHSNEFNPALLSFNKLSLKAGDFYYDRNLTKVSLQQFSAIDQNGFAINRLSTHFSMDKHSIATRELKLETPNSSIDADFRLQFLSLDQFLETYQFSDLKLEMRRVSFKNPDVLYFSRALNKLHFFQNNTNRTSITGKINGPMNRLTGEKLLITTGQNTRLETDFIIRGLPDIETASFTFPKLIIRSGKNDLIMMAGPSIPELIEIPEHIDLQLAFNGMLKAFETKARLKSSFGAANLTASLDASENFKSTVVFKQLDLGRLLKDTLLYGPLSLTAEATGQGLDLDSIKGEIKAEATQLYLNQYNYQNLTLDGTVSGKQFEGEIRLNDENAVFDFNGLVNLNPGQERYQFRLNMPGIDLHKLHLVDKDVRMSFVAEADLTGGSVNNLNGSAGITDIVVVHEDQIYRLESLLSASVNEARRSEFNINSALVGIKYAGTLSPAALPALLTRFVNNYFPLPDSLAPLAKSEHSKFNFEIELHNHPILSDLLLPGLNEFIPGSITGSFDSETSELKLDASISKMIYGTTEIRDFALAVHSDPKTLNYKISTPYISNTLMSLSNFLIDGKLQNKQLTTSISSIDEKLYKKLFISALITKENDHYQLVLDPANFYLMNKRWDLAPDHSIEWGQQGLLFHRLNMSNAESRISIASLNNSFNDDLKIVIENFELSDLSGIVSKDSSMVKGTIDGNVLLKRVNESYGLIADAGISNLFFRNIPVGNLTIKAENTTATRFNIDASLSGAENQLSVKGYYIPDGGANSINITSQVESLTMKTLEAFSMGEITETSGTASGDFTIAGNTAKPEMTGQLLFNNAFLKPAFLNNRIELKHESIQLKNDGIYFNNFTLADTEQNKAVLNGAVKMKNFSHFNFDFSLNSSDFMLFNTTVHDNKTFFGRMIIDSKIDVSGPMALPVVKARLKMKKGSSFTFVVPEDRLTTNKGEDVVEFSSGLQLNPILTRAKHTGIQKSGMRGFDVSSIIEIDKEATLRLLVDPASTDSLVVKGEAALSFSMDPGGMMSLTGAYNLSEGSYLVSLESIIKKQFDIDNGSTIIWNGDPLDATININARHTVRASPYDLVADQLSGLNDLDKEAYKQRYPFVVILKLRGKILQPEISFEIQLEPEDKGIMAGSIDQKLSMLNQDPSGLNKQVFALLVLGRFVQENPFEAELGSPSAMIRTTVGKFLSAQLNQLSSKVIPGMELNFDIQSYDDYQTGQAEGRTEVEIGLKKQLFNERLSVQIGGTVDVEGEEAKHNSTSDLASDVTVEYKLNKEGSFRLKGFRHDKYEGAIEGRLVETGLGLMYVKDFNSWRSAFRMRRRAAKIPPEAPKDAP